MDTLPSCVIVSSLWTARKSCLPRKKPKPGGLFEKVLVDLKKVIYIHLRRVHPIRVTTKTNKDVTFAFEDAYWDEYAAAQEDAVEHIENVEVIKEAAALAFAAAYPNKKKVTEEDDATKGGMNIHAHIIRVVRFE
ncbi:hypothetical protein CPB97_004138 [Podila verticillata]|nr:hypothetical protein CPB97_004138 [Podila verticillata]